VIRKPTDAAEMLSAEFEFPHFTRQGREAGRLGRAGPSVTGSLAYTTRHPAANRVTTHMAAYRGQQLQCGKVAVGCAASGWRQNDPEGQCPLPGGSADRKDRHE
jgi:hypothetical protein